MPLVVAALNWLILAQDKRAPGLFDFTGPLIPLLLIGMLFYFMIFRTERRKRQEQSSMLDNLKKNDRVITIGGIYGTVVNVGKGAEDVTIRVDEGNNTRLRVQRAAIARVLTADSGVKDEKEGKVNKHGGE